MKLAIATCYNIPEPDVDENLTLDAFKRRGHDVSLIEWENQDVDWSEFDGVIIRSTWNYPDYANQFAEWIRHVDSVTKLLNPASIMLQNMNKHYLTDLAQKGFPVVPTEWILAGKASELRGKVSDKFVLKPTIGNGSIDTRVFELEEIDTAIEWLGGFEPGAEFMIQTFLNSVNTVGEQSIIVIGDQPTHRIIKHPRYDGQDERVDGPFEVGEFEAIAREFVASIPKSLLYARVDLMMDNSEAWRLSELELIEPSLFFRQNPSALELLIDRAESLLS